MTLAAAASHGTLNPSPWIVRFAHLISRGAQVLDVACGAGRHARYFAGRGASVLAVDRDGAALAKLDGVKGITPCAFDLETGTWPFEGQRFAGVVVTNYLYRPLFPILLTALAADGVLLYETFARGNEAYGRPSNPDFLLEPGELLRLAGDQLTVIAFEQGDERGNTVAGARRAVVQRLAAVGPGRAWPSVLDAR